MLFISTCVFALGTRRYGGIELLLENFVEELVKLGHVVSVAAPKGSKAPKGCELIETIDLRFHKGFGDAEVLAYEWYRHRLRDFDCIHDFSHQKVAGHSNPDGPFINMLWIEPIYFTESQGGILHPVPMFNNVACSEFQTRRFREVYKRNVRYHPSICVNAEKYTFCSEKSERFVFVQKMSKEKGVLEAIRMCKELGVGLDVVGGKGSPGDPEFYMNQVIDECDDKQIVYYGNVHEDVKIMLMQRAKAMLYPMQFVEPHNMACAEAMVCGTPVIGFRRGAMEEVVEHDVTGFLANDYSEFKDYMKGVDELEPKKVHEVALERYSREKIVKGWLPLYDSVARGERV